eukprot:m.44358 g.44358  ORF g.44358 m.44358 type:complete len:539 (-) comp11700_c0_seq1:2252-3868(-)
MCELHALAVVIAIAISSATATFPATAQPPCVYASHPNVSFISDNILSCADGLGYDACRRLCDAEPLCTNFGLYVRGPRIGRCCTKLSNTAATPWSEGTSYTKTNAQQCAPPHPEIQKTMMFNCSAQWPYTHQGMLAVVDGEAPPSATNGRRGDKYDSSGKTAPVVVGTLQAGSGEGSADQRVLVTASLDGGLSWQPARVAVNASCSTCTQWSPVLFYDHHDSALWLFFSENVGNATRESGSKIQTGAGDAGGDHRSAATAAYRSGPEAKGTRGDDPTAGSADSSTTNTTATYSGRLVVFCTRSLDRGKTWSRKRAIFNSGDLGGNVLWVLNKVVELPTGDWVLPADVLGTPEGARALSLISRDNGTTWTAQGLLDVPGSTFPEPAMALVNDSSTLLALVRARGTGLYQSTSTDGGKTWATAAPAGGTLHLGTSSKPALWSVGQPGARGGMQGAQHALLLLAYNIGPSRDTLVLAASRNGGASFETYAVLEETAGGSFCYPTVITHSGNTILVAYTVYGSHQPTHWARLGIRVAILKLQ